MGCVPIFNIFILRFLGIVEAKTVQQKASMDADNHSCNNSRKH